MTSPRALSGRGFLPRILAWAFALPLLLGALAAQAEVRGVWVARDGLVSRQKIVSTLDQLAAANINVVCVNVWSRGYTIHPSDVLFAACGVRQDPDYVGRDPLAEFLFEAHRRGIEVEAWFEYGFCFGWSGWFAGPSGVGPVLTANPSWIARDQAGNSQVSDGGTGYFTWAIHEHPQVRQLLIDMATELVDRYDVDGVQFDRIRYPSTAFGYDPVTSAAYQAATGQNPPGNANQSQWKRWRADRLSQFHADFYAAVKLHRPSVRVTNAPVVYPQSYDSFLQDWPAWVSGGSIDLCYPQVYRTTASSYVTTLDQQLASVPSALRGKIAPGIRAITGTPTNEVLAMVAADRARNLPGHVFWYAEGLYDDLPALSSNYFQAPAAVPGRPAGHRPPLLQREENDPTTVVQGFLPLAVGGSSGGFAALSPPTSQPGDRVVFSLPVSYAGLYDLMAFVPAGGGYSAASPVRVAHAGGVETVLFDQSTADPDGWKPLGSYWLAPPAVAVEFGSTPGSWTVADSVAVLRSHLGSAAIGSLGAGTMGGAGTPALSMAGRAAIGGSLRLQAAGVVPAVPVVFGLGVAPSITPAFGGTVYTSPVLSWLGISGPQGRADLLLPIPFDPALRGLPLYAQAFAFDPAATGGIALTNAATAAGLE